MKKNFITTLLMSAASMFVAFTLTACGEEVIIDENNSIAVKPGQTLFSTGGGETRTSMDADRYFYWESGDKIWVKCIAVDDRGRIKLCRREAMRERDAQARGEA